MRVVQGSPGLLTVVTFLYSIFPLLFVDSSVRVAVCDLRAGARVARRAVSIVFVCAWRGDRAPVGVVCVIERWPGLVAFRALFSAVFSVRCVIFCHVSSAAVSPVFWVRRAFRSVLPGDVCLFSRRLSRVFGVDVLCIVGVVPAVAVGVTCVGRSLVFGSRASFLLLGAARMFRTIFVCFIFRVTGAYGFGSRFLRTFDRLLFGVGA